jgi:hypothetical protein
MCNEAYHSGTTLITLSQFSKQRGSKASFICVVSALSHLLLINIQVSRTFLIKSTVVSPTSWLK